MRKLAVGSDSFAEHNLQRLIAIRFFPQNVGERALDRVYPVVFIDEVPGKVRAGQVTNPPVYAAIAPWDVAGTRRGRNTPAATASQRTEARVDA